MFENNSNKIIEKLITFNKDNSIIFDNKIFKKYKRENKYKTKDNIKRVVFKCVNYRKKEYKKKFTKSFCPATIIYIEPDQGQIPGYYFKKDHSIECHSIINNKNKKKRFAKKRKKIIYNFVKIL